MIVVELVQAMLLHVLFAAATRHVPQSSDCPHSNSPIATVVPTGVTDVVAWLYLGASAGMVASPGTVVFVANSPFCRDRLVIVRPKAAPLAGCRIVQMRSIQGLFFWMLPIKKTSGVAVMLHSIVK